MSPLLNAYLRLCLLRIGPQDLPSSAFLLQLAALAMFVTGCLMLFMEAGMTAVVIFAIVLDMLLTAALVYGALAVTGHLARYRQTLAAMFGSSALLQTFSIPLLLLIGDEPGASVLSQLAVLAFVVLIFWSLTVAGHILRHALNLPMWAGVALAMGYWIAINQLLPALGLV